MEIPFRLRPAKDTDALTISAVITQTLRESNAPDYPEEVITRLTGEFNVDAVQAQLKTRDFLLACQEDEVLGTAALDGDTIRSVFVLPAHQGRGIGSALMAAVTRIARDRGVTMLQVSASITAVPFYKALGYQTVKDILYKQERTTWMQKHLPRVSVKA